MDGMASVQCRRKRPEAKVGLRLTKTFKAGGSFFSAADAANLPPRTKPSHKALQQRPTFFPSASALRDGSQELRRHIHPEPIHGRGHQLRARAELAFGPALQRLLRRGDVRRDDRERRLDALEAILQALRELEPADEQRATSAKHKSRLRCSSLGLVIQAALRNWM